MQHAAKLPSRVRSRAPSGMSALLCLLRQPHIQRHPELPNFSVCSSKNLELFAIFSLQSIDQRRIVLKRNILNQDSENAIKIIQERCGYPKASSARRITRNGLIVFFYMKIFWAFELLSAFDLVPYCSNHSRQFMTRHPWIETLVPIQQSCLH